MQCNAENMRSATFHKYYQNTVQDDSMSCVSTSFRAFVEIFVTFTVKWINILLYNQL